MLATCSLGCPLSRRTRRPRRERPLAAAADASPLDETSRLPPTDFRRLNRLRDLSDKLESPAGRASAAEEAGASLDASHPPARGLDRLMQAARFRKKQLSEQPLGGLGDEQSSSRVDARVPWRSRLSAAGGSHAETQERQAWQLKLTLAAKARNAESARALLAEMSDANCPPGPREYHCVVAAYALVGEVDNVLAVMHEQQARGGRALLETYKALIRASAGVAQPSLAIEAQDAARRAGYDDYDSWRLLCNCLFAARAAVEAFQAVDQGKARGLVPGEDTALHMLRFVGELGLQPEATKLWEQFQTWGLNLTREHHNAFMDAMTYTFGKRDTLQMQILGAAFPDMDTAGVNQSLAAMRDHPTQLGDTGEAWNPSGLLRFMEANLAKQGCSPDALTHVLAVDVASKMGEMELAMHHFCRLAETPEAAGSSGASLLSAAQVAVLLTRLASQGRGEQLLAVLHALHADGLPLPTPLADMDVNGRTLASRWLAVERGLSLDLGMINMRKERDDRSARTAASREAREERVWRGGPRFIFPSLSKMKIGDLRTEAAQLGLSDSGARKELYERVRLARQEVKDGTASAELLAAASKLFEAEPEQPQARRVGSTVEVAMEDGELVESVRGGGEVGPVRTPGAARFSSSSTPLQARSAWRDALLPAAGALALGVALCEVLQRLGAAPTQADLICIAREAPAAADAPSALRLLRSAAAAPGGACVQLYVLAAEACVACDDRTSALRCLDEADLAGYEVSASLLQRILLGGEQRAGTFGATSAADAVRLDGDAAVRRVALC